MKKALLFSALTIFISSCTVEVRIDGCTDPMAYNYDAQADDDNGSCLYILGCTDPLADNYDPEAGLEPLNGCEYSCDIVWYLTPSAGQFMLDWGIDYYHFFLKSESLSFGSISNEWVWNIAPNCNYQADGSTLVKTFYWSGNYDNFSAIVEWEAWADNGTNNLILDYEGTNIVYPNECIAIGLTSQKLKIYKEENIGKERKERSK